MTKHLLSKKLTSYFIYEFVENFSLTRISQLGYHIYKFVNFCLFYEIDKLAIMFVFKKLV